MGSECNPEHESGARLSGPNLVLAMLPCSSKQMNYHRKLIASTQYFQGYKGCFIYVHRTHTSKKIAPVRADIQQAWTRTPAFPLNMVSTSYRLVSILNVTPNDCMVQRNLLVQHTCQKSESILDFKRSMQNQTFRI